MTERTDISMGGGLGRNGLYIWLAERGRYVENFQGHEVFVREGRVCSREINMRTGEGLLKEGGW